MGTITKKKMSTSSWSKMFPNEMGTYSSSLVFLKKLFALSVSNIMYVRAIFPEEAFVDRSLEGLNVKILTAKNCCPGAVKVVNWVRGCFDALDQQYLRAAIIGIYDDPRDPDTVLESYKFKFVYTKPKEDGSSASPAEFNVNRSIGTSNETQLIAHHTTEEIRAATIRLFRTMVVAAQTLKDLPKGTFLTMRLLYYDNVTPSDYEPLGFKSADHIGFRYATEIVNVKVGNVDTDYHGFRTLISTDKNFFDNPESATAMLNTTGADSTAGSVSGSQYSKLKRGHSAPNNKNNTDVKKLRKNENFTVNCVCEYNTDKGIMIACELCRNWQHATCYGICEEDDAPEKHICLECSVQKPELLGSKGVTCDKLLSLYGDNNAPKTLCLMRTALLLLRANENTPRLTSPKLAQNLGCQVSVATSILNKLSDEGVLKSNGKGKEIDRAKLKQVIKKYFRTNNREK